MTGLLSSWISLLPRGVRWAGAATLLYLLAFGFSPGAWLQAPITFAFLLICPGVLLIDWLDLSDVVIAVAIVIPSSLATNILVSTILVGTRTYTAGAGLIASAAVTLSLMFLSFALQEARIGYEQLRWQTR